MPRELKLNLNIKEDMAEFQKAAELFITGMDAVTHTMHKIQESIQEQLGMPKHQYVSMIDEHVKEHREHLEKMRAEMSAAMEAAAQLSLDMANHNFFELVKTRYPMFTFLQSQVSLNKSLNPPVSRLIVGYLNQAFSFYYPTMDGDWGPARKVWQAGIYAQLDELKNYLNG